MRKKKRSKKKKKKKYNKKKHTKNPEKMDNGYYSIQLNIYCLYINTS